MTVNGSYSRRSFLRSIVTISGSLMLPISFLGVNERIRNIFPTVTPSEIRNKHIPILGIGPFGDTAIRSLVKENLINFYPQTGFLNIKKNKTHICPAFILIQTDAFLKIFSLLIDTISHCRDRGYIATIIINNNSDKSIEYSDQWKKQLSKYCNSYLVHQSLDNDLTRFFLQLDQILWPHHDIIFLEESELGNFLFNSGKWTIGWNDAVGENAARNAIPKSVQSAINHDYQIPKRMLVHFHVPENTPLYQIAEAMDYVFDLGDSYEIDILFSATTNKSDSNRASICVMAGDFQKTTLNLFGEL